MLVITELIQNSIWTNMKKLNVKLKVIIIQVGLIRKCAPALSSDFVNKQYLK